MSDPAKYRSKEELENYKKIDPILSMYDYIISNKIANESKIENIEAEISKVVEDAYNFALESSEPSIKELDTDIYCNCCCAFFHHVLAVSSQPKSLAYCRTAIGPLPGHSI